MWEWIGLEWTGGRYLPGTFLGLSDKVTALFTVQVSNFACLDLHRRKGPVRQKWGNTGKRRKNGRDVGRKYFSG